MGYYPPSIVRCSISRTGWPTSKKPSPVVAACQSSACRRAATRSMRPSLNRSARSIVNALWVTLVMGRRRKCSLAIGTVTISSALDAACDPRRACHVVEENQSSPGPQYAGHLVQCPIDVGYRAQPECARDGVEFGVVEWQRLRIALLEHDLASEIACAVPGNLEHLVTEIDSREADVRRVRVEI